MGGTELQSFYSSGWRRPVFASFLRTLLDEECKNEGLFVDVGATYGYFSLFAATLGCRVVAFEPNPLLSPFITTSIEFNGLQDRISFFPFVVSDVHNRSVKFQIDQEELPRSRVVSEKGGKKDSSSLSSSLSSSSSSSTPDVVDLYTTQFDRVVHQDISAIQIEVEGMEVNVLNSLLNAINKYEMKVKHILVDWRSAQRTQKGATVLTLLSGLGFEVLLLPGDVHINATSPIPTTTTTSHTATVANYEGNELEWKSDWVAKAKLVEVEDFGKVQVDYLWIRKK